METPPLRSCISTLRLSSLSIGLQHFHHHPEIYGCTRARGFRLGCLQRPWDLVFLLIQIITYYTKLYHILWMRVLSWPSKAIKDVQTHLTGNLFIWCSWGAGLQFREGSAFSLAHGQKNCSGSKHESGWFLARSRTPVNFYDELQHGEDWTRAVPPLHCFRAVLVDSIDTYRHICLFGSLTSCFELQLFPPRFFHRFSKRGIWTLNEAFLALGPLRFGRGRSHVSMPSPRRRGALLQPHTKLDWMMIFIGWWWWFYLQKLLL